jgi:hypothetical protein
MMLRHRTYTMIARPTLPAARALLLLLPMAGTAALCAPAKQPPRNTVRGQGQLVGQNGQFGVVYSLQQGFNFAILSARFDVVPFPALNGAITAKTGEKLLIMDLAIKNAQPQDSYFATDDLFTAVDTTGTLYQSGPVSLASKGNTVTDLTLRPGQGLGQPELKDPLRVAFAIPATARIVKIMVNQGRVGRNDEKVIRYYVAGATKAEAGEAGDPKNVIAPLPQTVRDPADPSGAVALDEGKGTLGTYFPSGGFALRLDSFAFSTEALVEGNAPEEGQRYAVATLTAKSLIEDPLTMFEVTGGGDDPLYELTDADGERARPKSFRKAKRDEEPEREFKKGDEYSFRVVFSLPNNAAAKKLVLGVGYGRKWAYDVSGVK